MTNKEKRAKIKEILRKRFGQEGLYVFVIDEILYALNDPQEQPIEEMHINPDWKYENKINEIIRAIRALNKKVKGNI